MTSYRLHYFPESGNSYKLALMLALCGQPFDPVWTDFGGGITRTKEWRNTVNEMGEIPVLEDAGERLTQTAHILLRLAGRYSRFHGEDDSQQFEILRWLFWDNHKLSSYMATYRFLRSFTVSPDPHVLAFLRKRVDDHLDVIDKHLQLKTFMVGGRLTIADISLAVPLCFPKEESGYNLAKSHPSVYSWLARIASTPRWRPPYDLLPGRRLALALSRLGLLNVRRSND